ncbi:MAG: GldG family protein [Bryobacteraceae bacterium]|jgi:ABC-type uncharacterized transport system involved in gliding motility auxiliary subunit
MRFGWLKARQTKYSAYVTFFTLVILAVLAVANYLANEHNASYDSTKNKLYSLSDQTVKVAKGLKEDVAITYFDRSTEFSRARDLLGRYANLSRHLKIVYVDLEKSPQLARALGVRALGTIYVQIGPKREEAKSLTEEEITGALIRALKTGDRNACFVASSGELRIDDSNRGGLSALREALEKNNYKTRSVSLIGKPEVPADCTVLIVAAPRVDYTDAEAAAIQKYVEDGGRALFLLDPPLNVGRQPIGENPALVKLLDGWGVAVDKDLVRDMASFVAQLGPEAPAVVEYESQPIVREMKGLPTAFPLARSLEAKTSGKATVEKLFGTSADSYATTDLSGERSDPKKDKKGPFTLAVAATSTAGKQGRFVVVGSSMWATNALLPAPSLGNRDLFLNMMNWLSSDEDLISIRPKEPEDQSFAMTRPQGRLVFYCSLLIMPFAIVLSGFMVWWKRR